MSLPAHLGLRFLAVALACLAAAIGWAWCSAHADLRHRAEISAQRIAGQFERQPGLGSANLGSALAPGPARTAPAILALLPGICAEIRLGAETPQRVCADWDGLDATPDRLRAGVALDVATATVQQAVTYRGRTIGQVAAWPDPIAGASLIRQRIGFSASLATGLAAAVAGLGWFAASRLVAPAARIVDGLARLDAAPPGPPLPRFPIAAFDVIAGAGNALAARLAEAEAERRALLERLVAVQDAERQALARDLHDDFGQCLAALGARAALIEAAAPPDRADIREDARGIEAVVALMRESLGGALARLERPDLAQAGLVPALRDLVADWRAQLRAGPALHLVIADDLAADAAALPPEAAIGLYRIAQELLTNALRHGRPSRVFLRLERSAVPPRTTTLTVDDDGGRAASVDPATGGRGVAGIRARLAVLGGSLTLTATGSGLRARASIPTG